MLGTNLLHLILCYAAYVHSNPLIEHDGHIKFTVPKSYAALGDSYASGLGSGFFTNNSRDGLDGKFKTWAIIDLEALIDLSSILSKARWRVSHTTSQGFPFFTTSRPTVR